MNVQNQKTALEDVRPVIDENIVNTVHEIFAECLQDIFEDLANRLIEDLHANSFMDVNLELKEDQFEGKMTDELHCWIVDAMNEKWEREKPHDPEKPVTGIDPYVSEPKEYEK
jgi:hypothetical protein